MNDAPAFERIVVGLPADDRATDALRCGMFLSRVTKARLQVIHAVADESALKKVLDPTGADAAQERHVAEARAQLLARIDHLRDDRDPPAEELLAVRVGDPAAVLATFAAEASADLLIVGPHERHDLLDSADTAQSLLKDHAGAIWDQRVPFGPIHHIVVPVDLSPESWEAVGLAIRVARAVTARVEILHVYQPPSFAYKPGTSIAEEGPNYVIEEMKSKEKDVLLAEVQRIVAPGVSVKPRFEEGDAVEVLLEVSRECDLLVMTTHGRSAIKSLFTGNVTKEMLSRAEAPVLALRLPD